MSNASTQTVIRKTIENISSLPTLPTVLDRITRLLHNPQTSAEQIGKAITADQALASKVLRLVNSAFYGFPGKIATITHAVVILGFSTIKNIVLTTSIFDAFKSKKNRFSGFDLEQFWYHSIACGAAAQTIAKQIGFEERETCFIAGLIHDIGKVILCQYMPDHFEKIITEVRAKDILFYESERQLFDITHQEVGGILAERWNLPIDLQYAVQRHHTPSTASDHFMVSAVTHCADVLARALDIGNGGDDKIPAISEPVWRNLGMANVPLQPLLESIEHEVEKANIFKQVL